MARKAEQMRTLNVAIVGLAGTEKERGQSGLGKSCLCNRFIKTLADDYHVEHISVLSQVSFRRKPKLFDSFIVSSLFSLPLSWLVAIGIVSTLTQSSGTRTRPIQSATLFPITIVMIVFLLVCSFSLNRLRHNRIDRRGSHGSFPRTERGRERQR